MSDIFNQFCALIGGPEFGLTGAKTYVGTTDTFPCGGNPTAEDDESNY